MIFFESNGELLAYDYGAQYNKHEVIILWKRKILFLS